MKCHIHFDEGLAFSPLYIELYISQWYIIHQLGRGKVGQCIPIITKHKITSNFVQPKKQHFVAIFRLQIFTHLILKTGFEAGL